jgi:hypothetical protein
MHILISLISSTIKGSSMKKGDKEKALIYEFGVPERGIPKRSFLRSNASK